MFAEAETRMLGTLSESDRAALHAPLDRVARGVGDWRP